MTMDKDPGSAPKIELPPPLVQRALVDEIMAKGEKGINKDDAIIVANLVWKRLQPVIDRAIEDRFYAKIGTENKALPVNKQGVVISSKDVKDIDAI